MSQQRKITHDSWLPIYEWHMLQIGHSVQDIKQISRKTYPFSSNPVRVSRCRDGDKVAERVQTRLTRPERRMGQEEEEEEREIGVSRAAGVRAGVKGVDRQSESAERKRSTEAGENRWKPPPPAFRCCCCRLCAHAFCAACAPAKYSDSPQPRSLPFSPSLSV